MYLCFSSDTSTSTSIFAAPPIDFNFTFFDFERPSNNVSSSSALNLHYLWLPAEVEPPDWLAS